jgi:hypothetical protein
MLRVADIDDTQATDFSLPWPGPVGFSRYANSWFGFCFLLGHATVTLHGDISLLQRLARKALRYSRS